MLNNDVGVEACKACGTANAASKPSVASAPAKPAVIAPGPLFAAGKSTPGVLGGIYGPKVLVGVVTSYILVHYCG